MIRITAVRARAAAAAPGSTRRVAVWRSVAAAPAIVGSLLLMSTLSAALGGWQPLVLVSWLAAGALLLTPAGERGVLRVLAGFRRPSADQAAALSAPMAAALRRTGVADVDIDVYVRACARPNAYAAGRRGVAVTTGALDRLLAHRLTDEQMVAVLVHELGHHAGRAARAALVVAWLTAPWRLASRLVFRLADAVAGHPPRLLLPVVVCTGVVLAVVQALARHDWAVAGLLGAVAALAVICPLGDAALARAEELSADRYAASLGFAWPLAAALRVLHDGHGTVRGWSRLLASHPTADRRIDALIAAADRPSARTVRPDTARTAGELYSNRYSNAARTGPNMPVRA